MFRHIKPALQKPLISFRLVSTIEYSPPPLSNLDLKIWNKTSPPVREEIIEYLQWKMEDDWHEVTKDEVKAAYFISYGIWGPRSSPGSNDSHFQTSSELIVRGLASIVLFTALITTAFAYKHDRALYKKLEKLKTRYCQ